MAMVNFDRVMFIFVAMFAVAYFLASDHACLAQTPDFSSPPKANRSGNSQQTQRTPARRQPQRKPAAKGKASKFPAPETVTVETKDGVTLTCTWFAPEGAAASRGAGGNAATSTTQVSAKGKSTAPFILLHDWDRSREDLLYLGRFLQLSGHAVIVPDFRGHGESLTVAGSKRPIDRSRFRKKEMATLLGDVEACKKFLMRKNDAGELNIDLLNVAAVGKSAILAMQWAISDWSWAPVGSIKQGQDVKSLILIAPEQKLKGLSIKPLLKHPLFVGERAEPLPMLVIYSASHPESVEQSTEIYDGIKKGRSRYAKAWRETMAEQKKMAEQRQEEEPVAAAGESEPDKEQPKVVPPPPPIDPMKTFVSGPVPRENKPGSELIASPKSQGVFRFIDNFVKQAILSRQVAYPWRERLGR